ncbi:MAG: LacI family DNA-binding transcriptional regulator, partial [Clostridia bacterium]|nr:LacI family DNA-binding transcriptional regulator [Clostridia bacterium]
TSRRGDKLLMEENKRSEQCCRDDVARLAGVSGATVSYVFSRKRYVSPELVRRVMRAAEELDYHPDLLAAAVRRKSSDTIAVLTDDMASPLQIEIIRAIQESAMNSGYFTHICGGVKNLDSYVDDFICRKVDGVFLSVDPAKVNNKSIEKLLDRGISVIITSLRGFSDPRVCGLELDFGAGVSMLVEHFKDLGHSKIAFLSCFDDSYEYDKRLKSFGNNMQRLFGEANPVTVCGSPPWESTIDRGYELAKKLMSTGAEFTAVSVAGMDDILFARSSYPALTTISHRSLEYGHRIFGILKQNIDNKSVVSRERISPSLVVRESTAVCKSVNK